jgi:hypothetical protein
MTAQQPNHLSFLAPHRHFMTMSMVGQNFAPHFSKANADYGDTFLELADQYTERSSNGTYDSNELDSGAIIDCLDWPDTRTIEETKADAKRFSDAAPVFGPYLAYTNIACKYLTAPTKDKLTRATNKITSIKYRTHHCHRHHP